MGTLPTVPCAANAGVDNEPLPDANPFDFNDDQYADLSDVLKFNTPGVFGATAPSAAYNIRFDFNGDGSVDLSDVLKYNITGIFGQSCAP